MIVHAHTVVHPWAMTDRVSFVPLQHSRLAQLHLLIMLCHASLASFAVLASQRHADHAMHTEVLLIKLPETQKIINSRLLLSQSR